MLKFLLPSFYLSSFSISHSNLMHMEFDVNEFSGTATPGSLKFGKTFDMTSGIV